jgi:hypothetical protein
MIAPILAQIESVPASDFKSWVLIAIGVLGCISLVKSTFFGSATRISGGEIDVREGPQWVAKGEFAEFQASVEKRLAKMRDDMSSMQNGRVSDLADLRVEIRQDIQRIHTRIDDIPDRIIATLKNTGAIQ